MGTPVDQYTDRTCGSDFPQMLRDMVAQRQDAGQKTAAAPVYAWPDRQLFPLHTAEDILLSACYAIKQAAEVPSDVRHVVQRCYDAHVPGGWDRLASLLVGTLTKTAAEQPEQPVREAAPVYAFPQEQRLPLHTPELLQKSAEALDEQWAHLAYPALNRAADRILAQAVALGVEPPGRLYKYAGRAEPSAEHYLLQVGLRRQALRPLARQAYQTKEAGARGVSEEEMLLRDELLQRAERTYARLEGLAGHLGPHSTQDDVTHVMNQLKLADAATGLDRAYGTRGLEPPQMAVLGEEPAREHLKLAQMVMPMDSIQGLPLTFWSDALGPEFAEAVADATQTAADPEKLRDIIPTLPLDMRQSLERSLSALGRPR